MTTTAAPTRLAVRAIPALSLGRDCHVEARKLVDTRASLALVVATFLLTGAFAGGAVLFASTGRTLGNVIALAAWPGSMLLMVMATLLITSEFTSGTAAVTFTLEPRRSRVLFAKGLVVVAASLALMAFAGVVSVAAAMVGPLMSAPAVPLTFDGVRVAATAGGLVFAALSGLAWGLATRNAPVPLVLLLAWPTVAQLLGSLSDTVATAAGYVDLQATFAFVTDPQHAVARLVSSTLVWIVLPGALGAWRLLRGDLS